MMHILNDFYIKCNNCGLRTKVIADNLECESYVIVEDQPMGDEIEHDFTGEFCCDKCQSSISFIIRGYEYPAGAYNYSDSECSGGEFVNEPAVDMYYSFDEFFYDEAYHEFQLMECWLSKERDLIKRMSPRDFENYVAGIFEKLGFNVKVTKATRDGGKDIIATKAYPIPYTLIIECKHWSDEHHVDVSVVRSVYGVQTAMKANQAVIVTSSKFTSDARNFAEKQEHLMALWDIDDLLNLVMQQRYR